MTFFDQYSYKQKNYALLVLVILLVAASYKRVFKITFESIAYKKELEQKIVQAKSAAVDLKIVQSEINYLNKLLGKEDVTIEKVQQGFLNFQTLNSSRLIVYQVDEVLSYQHPDFTINTHRIVLKGGFIHVLKFIYQLEKEFDLAKLINVSFEFKKYNSEESEALYTTLLLQNYQR